MSPPAQKQPGASSHAPKPPSQSPPGWGLLPQSTPLPPPPAPYFVGGGNAWDFGLGFWSYGWGCNNRNDRRYCDGRGGFNRLSANIDYLWQDNLIPGGGARLDWHIGGGGRIWAGDGNFAAAARMPVGVDLMFRKPSFLEVFLEIAPALYIVPGLYLDVEAFLGVRFYF
jgi:hypothetical protein